jgi:hypothetical protein
MKNRKEEAIQNVLEKLIIGGKNRSGKRGKST